MFAISLQRGSAVLDELLERFGPSRLCRVEQMSPHGFRAYLSGGGIALAVVGADGRVCIKEVEVGE